MNPKRPYVVVPQEAAERGVIVKGELRSSHGKIPEILAQFDKVSPQSKKLKIYFYPTLEQAQMLFGMPPPFSFEGSLASRDGEEEFWRSTEIWTKSGSEIRYGEMICLTHCSGQLVDLHVRATSQRTPTAQGSHSAWFATNGCSLLESLATPDEEEILRAKKYGIERPKFSFSLSDGSSAEIRRTMVQGSQKANKDVSKFCYVIQVTGLKDFEIAKRDVECILILASLASRERAISWHWSADMNLNVHERYWRFGMGKLPRRPRREEPLVLRDQASCSDFLAVASKKYLSSKKSRLLDSAVYALLTPGLPLETQIVRLLSGIQSALRFAVPTSSRATNRTLVNDLYKQFEQHHCIDISDLWPLFKGGAGVSLSEIRNSAVHGEVFTEMDWIPLSYAAHNLRWILERILLTCLGWDVKRSYVSPSSLNWYTSYQWKAKQLQLTL